MADYRKHLDMIPEHMHHSVEQWVEHGEPAPAAMGSFLRAVLSNDLIGAACHADEHNARAFFQWAKFIWLHLPQTSWGSLQHLDAWYDRHRATKEVQNAT